MNNAIILIKSPFQLLCAINAIKDFEITNYKLYLFNNERIDQIISIANYFNLQFKIIPGLRKNVAKSFFFYYNLFFRKFEKYDYLFVGDIRETHIILRGIIWLKMVNSIVYLDDGNVTIPFFLNKIVFPFRQKLKMRLINTILYLRKIKKYYYTIYNVKSSDYIIINNPFKISNCNDSTTNISLFIGTNSELFCNYNGIKKDVYLTTLEKILKSISKSATKFMYIAHGRESFKEINVICNELNIQYIRPDKCIEMYLIEKNYNVISAYGFGSTALYNIKKMYPNSDVRNINFYGSNTQSCEEAKTISEVYNEIGISDIYPTDFN